jgi:hypothetical protein
MQQPKVVAIAYWLLHNCDFIVADPNDRRPQTIEPRPLEYPGMSLMKVEEELSLPAETSGNLLLEAGRNLPAGWQTAFARQAAEKPRDGEPPGPAACVLSFRKANAASAPKDGVTPHFRLRFTPAKGTMESDLAERMAADRGELAKWTAEQQHVNEEIKQVEDDSRRAQRHIMDQIAKTQRLARLPRGELIKGGVSAEELKKQLAGLDVALKAEQLSLANARKPLLEKKKACDDLCRHCAAAIAAYAQIAKIDVMIVSPEGLRHAVLHYEPDRPLATQAAAAGTRPATRPSN